MIVVVLVFVVGLLAASQSGCPIRCNCTDHSVNCISKSLEYVPYFESLSNVPVIIDLSGNYIPHIDIDDFSFDKSDQVKEVYLNNSNVNLIDEVAFEELENLQELYLAGNLLNSLFENFIVKNDNLIVLDLSNNLFVDFPKIRSTSLEVLALADSGISHLAAEALQELPNLRVLLLQQNNLKYVRPEAFANMDNLFHVKLSFNPWSCDCKTVKLFDYLLVKGFVEITEPVQCLDDNKNFMDIYDGKGVTTAFKDQCAASSKVQRFIEVQELIKELEVDDDQLQESYSLTKASRDVSTSEEDDHSGRDFIQVEQVYLYLLIFIAIPLSLTLGVVFGSCVTYRYMLIHMNRLKNESMKELLTYHKEQFM